MTEAARRAIAVVVPSLAGGGAEAVALRLSSSFASQGHPVDLVVGSAHGARRGATPGGVRLVELGTRRMSRAVPAIARYLRGSRPDGVVGILDQANIAVLLARRAAGVRTRTVATVHNLVSPAVLRMPLARRVAFLAAIRRLYPRADAIVAPSAAVAEDLVAVLARDLPVAVIPNPVDVAGIRARAEATRLAPPDGIPVVLAAGRLVAVKDFPLLLHAFAVVRRSVSARLIIAGDGELRADLEALAADLGIDQDVEMPGFVPDVVPCLARAAVAATTSREEGLPTFVIEALAAGTPVVAAAGRGGTAEVLDGGRLGRLVPTRDPADVAEAMRNLLAAPRVPVDLTELERFRPDAVTAAYLQLLVTPA